jgi:hypothetical protein
VSYLGRYQLGQEVTFRPHALSSSGQPQLPDSAPRFAAYLGSTQSSSGRTPSLDRTLITGLFEGKILLDEAFSAGQYTVLVTWAVSGVQKAALFTFTVLPGAGPTGQVTAMFSYPRPQANHIVQARSTGRIYKGRNPRGS